MAVKGWKKNKGRPETKRVKRTSIVEDQISRLPDSVIGHILSFLPTKDAARTCLLSKRWKLVWHSVPILSFSDDNFESSRDFCNHVENCLENRKRGMYYMGNSIITSFNLEVSYFCEARDSALVDKWLAFVLNNKVKEISLRFNSYDGDYYYFLPETVVNSRYLTMLELERLDLGTKPRLPALKTLSLKWCGFDDDGLGDGLFMFLLGCPSLEKLVIESSDNLSSAGHQLRLQSSSLKFVKIDNLQNVVPLKVEATNLESLELSGFIFGNSSLSACKAIRNLSLTFHDNNGIDEYSFSLDHIIANFPLLENLTLKDCYKLKLDHCKQIEISNQHLKSFNLKNENASYDDGLHIVIKSAPNLTSFCYEGNINFSIAGKSSNSLNGRFVIRSLHNENYDSNWFNRMMIFLLNLNCSWNIITLHVHSDKDLILSEDFKRICRTPLLDWKHLRIITDCNAKRMSELKDALMWISPSLETLSINQKFL